MRILPILSLCLASGTAAAQWPPLPRTPKPPKPPREAPGPGVISPEPFVFPDFQFPDFHFDFDWHGFELDELRWQLDELAGTPLPDLEGVLWQLDELAGTPLPELEVISPFPAQAEAVHPSPLPAPSFPEPPLHARGQDSPGDSLYRLARETVNRGEYRRAFELFRSFEQRYPNSRYAPAALYWQAFALYRTGVDEDLRQALTVLDRQRTRYANAAGQDDASALYTRVAGALAARGDLEARARLQGATQASQACDREELSVRQEALSALVQADPAGARTLLRRVLARRDDCSAPLRRRAVYLLAREGGAGITAELLAVARNDPDDDVRRDAVSHLARQPGEEGARALQELFGTAQEERTQRAILAALARHESESVRQFVRRAIEREDLAEAVRAEAIRSLYRRTGGRNEPAMADADAAYMRSLYGRTTSRAVRSVILETLARAGGSANDAWLMGIIRNQNEEMRYRRAALSRLRRSDVPVGELTSLYDALTERDLRSSIISALGARDEPAATDKLIEIARSGTDPRLRRQAISVLVKKNDPRTTKLLLELVEP